MSANLFSIQELSLDRLNLILYKIKENLDDDENLLVTPFTIDIKINAIPKEPLNFFISKMKKVGFFIETSDSSNQQENRSFTIKITKVPTILFKRLKQKNENDILLILNNLIETELKVKTHIINLNKLDT